MIESWGHKRRIDLILQSDRCVSEKRGRWRLSVDTDTQKLDCVNKDRALSHAPLPAALRAQSSVRAQ